MLFGTQRINDRGHLEIGGCDAVELARQFGTPLYVIDEQHLRDNCRAYRQAFESRFADACICYAGKALLTTAICRIIDEEGLWLDVASAGELYTALKASFPPSRILMHGNFKLDTELRMALDAGVARIVVDSLSELDRLAAIAEEMDKRADILIRVAPGIRTHTHHHIQTGHADTKFGLGIASGAAMEAVEKALALPRIRLHGIHCHIGSQLFTLDEFARAAEVMTSFLAEIRDRTGRILPELDLGGGLGIAYTEEDAPPSIDELADVICDKLVEAIGHYDLPPPRLFLEPGRSIVGTAGVTLYTVGPVKHIPGVRTYVAVDGGLSDNPRPALYDAIYTAIVANKANMPRTMPVRVSGRHCETDTLIPEITLQPVEEGDILAVFCTGAYNYSMASNYNRFPRPALVLVRDGQAEVIVERETLDDLIAKDRIPPRLMP